MERRIREGEEDRWKVGKQKGERKERRRGKVGVYILFLKAVDGDWISLVLLHDKSLLGCRV